MAERANRELFKPQSQSIRVGTYLIKRRGKQSSAVRIPAVLVMKPGNLTLMFLSWHEAITWIPQVATRLIPWPLLRRLHEMKDKGGFKFGNVYDYPSNVRMLADVRH